MATIKIDKIIKVGDRFDIKIGKNTYHFGDLGVLREFTERENVKPIDVDMQKLVKLLLSADPTMQNYKNVTNATFNIG